MRVKTSELSGNDLDWAVAKCEGYETEISNGGWIVFDTYQDNPPPTNDYNDSRYQMYSPSTDWAHAGPIIERERVDLYHGGTWSAEMVQGEDVIHTEGPTPLIAAMRCFVASKLGDEVDVPDNEFLEREV
jgi:Protein of unknown function (DUF2591)